jgi:SAM-dependent methyltransferase
LPRRAPRPGSPSPSPVLPQLISVANAAPRGGLRQIGVLIAFSESDLLAHAFSKAFVEALGAWRRSLGVCEAYPMISTQTDPVKQLVAAHWNRRAAHFDEDFGHSIRTPAERAAWDRMFDLILPAAGGLDALDIGCGTGFLSLELASRGHRVIGIDFAPSMIAEARKKAAERQLTIGFEEGDAEQLPFAAISP